MFSVFRCVFFIRQEYCEEVFIAASFPGSWHSPDTTSTRSNRYDEFCLPRLCPGLNKALQEHVHQKSERLIHRMTASGFPNGLWCPCRQLHHLRILVSYRSGHHFYFFKYFSDEWVPIPESSDTRFEIFAFDGSKLHFRFVRSILGYARAQRARTKFSAALCIFWSIAWKSMPPLGTVWLRGARVLPEFIRKYLRVVTDKQVLIKHL